MEVKEEDTGKTADTTEEEATEVATEWVGTAATEATWVTWEAVIWDTGDMAEATCTRRNHTILHPLTCRTTTTKFSR